MAENTSPFKSASRYVNRIRLKPAGRDVNAPASEFGDELLRVDRLFLGSRTAIKDLASGHHLGDYRGRKGCGAHHGGEAGLFVVFVDDVVTEARCGILVNRHI